MFSTRKKIAALGIAAAAVATTGIASAYWTTTGSGTGLGDTTDGVENSLSFTQNELNTMFPGDTEQDVTVTIKNTSTESAYVATVEAYVTTGNPGCDGSDFLLDGVAAPVEADDTVAIAWTPRDMAAGTEYDAEATIQFNNKPTVDQDACKDAVVTIHYLAS